MIRETALDTTASFERASTRVRQRLADYLLLCAASTDRLDSRIEVSDFLPTLVRICEERIYQLCLSPVPAVRCEAVAFINVFLHQAVTNPADAMPTLVALLFDGKSAQTARQALHVLLSLADKKREYLSFVEQKLMAGVRLGFAMQASLWSADSVQQFDPLDALLTDGSTNSQIPFDYFAHLYGTLKKSAAQRKQIAHNLVNDLMLGQLLGETAMRGPLTASPLPTLPSSLDRLPSPSQPNQSPPTTPPLLSTPHPSHEPSLSPPSIAASHDTPSSSSRSNRFGFLCFVARLLLHLPFDDDEPLHLTFHLSKLINTRGATLLASMEQLVQEMQQAISGPTDEQRSRLAELADDAMCICVMVRVRQALIVSYALEGRLSDWSIATATAKNAVKCSKKSDEQMSFRSFPFADGSATESAPPDVSLQSTASVVKRGPSTPGRTPQPGKPPTGKSVRGRSKSTGHSRADSGSMAEAGTVHPIGATNSPAAIPPLLMAQYSFFVQQMAHAALFMQTGSGAVGGKQSGRKGVKGRKKRRQEDDSGTDDDNDDARTPSAAHSTPVKRAGSGGKATRQAAGGTPHKKRRKRLTFSDRDLAADAEEDEDDDEDWDGGD